MLARMLAAPDRHVQRRIQLVAAGCAVAALIAVSAAVVVVMTSWPSGRPTRSCVGERRVDVDDLIKLGSQDHHGVVAMTDASPTGVRVTDAALREALGLDAADVITSLSGRPIMRERDVHEFLLGVRDLGMTAIYVELVHDHQSVLRRWTLAGDLLAVARGAPPVTQPPPTPMMGPPAQPDLTPDDVDALVATIKQVGDHHVEVPQSTIDKILANPMAVASSARIVPAVNGGKPYGFRLYAIRPQSVWAASGFANGDTIRAVNGYDLTLPDKSLELYTRLRSAKEFEIDVERRGRPLTIEVDIK